MIPNERIKRILKAKVCPYCKGNTVRTNEEEIYGRVFKGRDIIRCENWPQCDSYVGCHDDGRPLGRLAGWGLRIDKRKAHEALDRLWKEKLMTRSETYRELSVHLELPVAYTHIGFFNEAACKKARTWAIERYFSLKGNKS